ncbi:Co-A ligase [Micromonospora sp. ATCC 39149]|nr:Co-A ligase [Micromonospora sp. ATCC 39149]
MRCSSPTPGPATTSGTGPGRCSAPTGSSPPTAKHSPSRGSATGPSPATAIGSPSRGPAATVVRRASRRGGARRRRCRPVPPAWGLSTSGSEGWPKCVERPWPTVTANARAFAAALELSPGEVVACTTPPHHSYALCGGIVTTLAAGGTYVALDRQPGPRTVADAVDRHRVAVLLSVPLLYRWFSAAGLTTRHRPRLCVSAGAPLPPEDRHRWAAAVGWRIGEHYGTSEHGMLTLDTGSVAGSVGRPIVGVTLVSRPGAESRSTS